MITLNKDKARELYKKELIGKFDGRLDVEILEYIVSHQKEFKFICNVEDNVFRIPDVDVTNLISRYYLNKQKKSQELNLKIYLDFEIDLNNNKFILFDNDLDEICDIAFSDLVEDDNSDRKDFNELKESLKSQTGFTMKISSEANIFWLEYDNLNKLTLKDISLVLSELDTYSFNHISDAITNN